MAEARSYARPGRFGNVIQAPQTATAKRRRDKEMVAELKEENQALKQRDAEFLAKYKEKLQKEKAARADVEEARRYSVESARRQHEANFNLAADFAQQEQEAQNKALEAFGDMLPKVGEAIAEEGVRRREAELEAKEAAWSRLDPTPEELREWRGVEDTSLFESGKKYAELRQRLEVNNITVDQFVKGLHLRGIDGVAASIVDVRRRVQSIPSILAKEIQEGTAYGKNNTPIGDLVNSTNVPGNDRSGLNDFTRKIHDYVNEGLNPIFVQKYVGEDLNLALANIRNTSDKNKQKQAQQIYDEKVYTETVGIASTPDSLHSTVDGRAEAYGGGEKGRYQALKGIFFDLQTPIETGQVPDNVITNISNTRIFDRVKGEMVPAIEHSWLGPRIRASLTKRRQLENAEFNSRQAFQNAQEQREVLEHRQYLMDNDLTIEQQEEWLQGLTNNPNPHVRIWAQKMLNSSITAQENYRQEQVLNHLHDKAAAGISISKEEVLNLGLGGKNLNAALKLAGQNAARAEHFKRADGDFDLALKQRRSDIPNQKHNHEQHSSVLHRMNADYRKKYDELKKGQGTSRKTDEEIHEEASNAVLKQFKDRTGVYEYVDKDGSPYKGYWPQIGQGQPDGDQPSLSITDAVKEHKLGFYNKPNTIFRQSELARMRTVQDITPVDWAQAREAANQAKLQGDTDVTKEQVIIAQLEAANLPVPAQLREIRDAQEKILNEIPPERRRDAHKAFSGLPGEQQFDRNNLKTSALNVQYDVPVSTDGLSRQVGITGERGRIGVGDEHHIDVKLSQSLPVEQRMRHFDDIAWMYHREGRVIEFSNQAVAGLQWNVMWSDAKKLEVYQAVAAAHRHSVHSGWDSIDYYVPFQGHNRNHHSAEYAPIYVPTIQGGHMIQKTGGGYGFNSQVFNPAGNLIIRIGHGRISDPMNKPLFNQRWY